MKKEKSEKYQVSKNEDFQLGSNDQVLSNLLGIINKNEMDQLEAIQLADLYNKLIEVYDTDYRFSNKDLKKMHFQWLGNIYSFAGKYRTVNMSKGGFPFAAANQIPSLMQNFEANILGKYTPCNFSNDDSIVHALAITHTELVLIHPFREGNGRLARLLATLMGLQAGLPILNFKDIQGKRLKEYIVAVQAGLDQNYQPMKNIFTLVIDRTLNDKLN